MKRTLTMVLVLILTVLLFACAGKTDNSGTVQTIGVPVDKQETPEPLGISVSKIEGISDDFIMGADISSLLSLEASGRVFYGFDGHEQDLLKTLSQSGINYIRVRVWNDPFDANGNGYGGGNCTVDTAIELGKRCAEYDMGLLVDFHYSDFWADPGKQQAPKAWGNMTMEDKTQAIYDYTAQSITKIQHNGIKIGMVQVGNETTGGLCGEWEKANVYRLMATAAQAVRDTDSRIQIAVHYTNPERKTYADYARDLNQYGVDYDIFATSYYPAYHGSIQNLKEQLTAVRSISGKKVMIAETSWAYTSNEVGAYKASVQGQADAISECVQTMVDFGDEGVGVFYWEPAWIDVSGENQTEIVAKREQYGAGWASSFAGSYDPEDAGQYYGGTACVPTALFDPDGYPLASLKTFLYLRQGTSCNIRNYISNASFEEEDPSAWRINEATIGTVNYQEKASDAKEGTRSLHFWCAESVSFTAEQTVEFLPKGQYDFSAYVQGDDTGERAVMKIYAISDGVRYEQSFTLDGWANWRVPMIEGIPCDTGTLTVGIEIRAAAGAWGSVDCVELLPKQ
ncbi:MAG: arabinogalactan endo-1,4-beta-galactosidase [Ruminococcaceae bacterium]|nr:arabinogalactan endo-1,4-beta-galactosidase [Oscillospiraceae bacterium]